MFYWVSGQGNGIHLGQIEGYWGEGEHKAPKAFYKRLRIDGRLPHAAFCSHPPNTSGPQLEDWAHSEGPGSDIAEGPAGGIRRCAVHSVSPEVRPWPRDMKEGGRVTQGTLRPPLPPDGDPERARAAGGYGRLGQALATVG